MVIEVAYRQTIKQTKKSSKTNQEKVIVAAQREGPLHMLSRLTKTFLSDKTKITIIMLPYENQPCIHQNPRQIIVLGAFSQTRSKLLASR